MNAPWIMKHVAFQINNIACIEEYQKMHKEHFLNVIDEITSLSGAETALSTLHYVDEYGSIERRHFITYMPSMMSGNSIVPTETIKEARNNVVEPWYKSHIIMLEINFLRMLLSCIACKSLPELKKISECRDSIYRVSKSVLKYSEDERVRRLAKQLAADYSPF